MYRRRKYKARYHKNAVKRAFPVVCVLMVFLFLGIAANAIKTEAASQVAINEEKEETLLSTEGPAKIEISVSCDKEPIQISLRNPNGRILTKNQFDSYKVSGSTITAGIKTNLAGTWRIRYNERGNTDVKIKAKAFTLPHVTIDHIETNVIANQVQLKIKASAHDYKEDPDLRLVVAIEPEGTKKEYILDDRPLSAYTSYIKYSLKSLPPEGKGKLKIMVTDGRTPSPYTTKKYRKQITWRKQKSAAANQRPRGHTKDIH